MLASMVSFALPVALDRRVATVEAVVAELARKAGRPLSIRPEMRDEAVFVRLGSHSPDETMALLARAASAEWTQEAGRTYLGRSPSFRRRQAAAEQAELAAELRARIAPLVGPEDAAPWVGGSGRAAAIVAEAASFDHTLASWPAHQARARALTPVGRLMLRALRRLPPAELAAVPPGSIVRFALRPTPRQRPLPEGLGVEWYVAERRMLAAEVARLPERPRGENALQPFRDETPIPDHPYVQLRAGRYGDGPVSLALSVYEAHGAILETDFLGLGESGHRGAALPGYDAWRARPLPVDPAVVRFFGEGRPDPGLAARLLDPVANEPLAAILGAPLDSLFGASGGEAIVALPDGLLARAGEALGAERATLGDLADALADRDALAPAGGILVGSARRPAEAALTKTDRALLRGLVRLAAARPTRLAEDVRYALAQNPEAVATEFEARVVAGLGLRTSVGAFPSLFDAGTGLRDVLRAWGGLSPAQQAALAGGGTVPIAEVGPAARLSLDTLLFRRAVTLAPVLPMRIVGPDPTMLADGLPPEMTLSGTDPTVGLVAAVGTDAPNRRAVYPAEFLGYALLAQERGEAPMAGFPRLRTDRFMPGAVAEFHLHVRLTPGYEAWSALSDVALDLPRRPVPYDALPPAHLKAIRDAYEKAKKDS